MPTIDADAHVVENEHTWDYLDPSDRKCRPALVDLKGNRVGGGRKAWYVDGKLRQAFTQLEITEEELAEVSQQTGRPVEVPLEARRLENVPLRLAHMDALGIDIQAMYPTMLIGEVTDKPAIDVALCRAYHRWLADIWRQSHGRLLWVAPLPLLSIPDALDMLPWCKEHGAVGVLMRAIEGQRLVHDPYFDPIYEAASRLDLPVAMHLSNGNYEFFHQVRSRVTWSGGFWSTVCPTIGAAYSLIEHRVPERHPNLRIGFVECAAQWVPWVTRDLQWEAEGRGQPLPENLFEAYRLYVSCYSSTDDIEYIARSTGDNVLMTGTDYGHTDMSAETDAIKRLAESGELRPELARKILEDNPARFYGLATAAG